VDKPEDVISVADKINKLNERKDPQPIFKVYYGQGTVEVLFKVTKMVQNVGLVLVVGLALTAMFLIANTIKLTILARRREISIMKLVGATNNFIRWPFFIEGAVLGLIGSAIPIIVLLYGYAQLLAAFKFELGIMLIQLLPFEEIRSVILLLLLSIGVVIGIWGSTLSVRKYLRV
jgi:cell division transport system permease protein